MFALSKIFAVGYWENMSKQVKILISCSFFLVDRTCKIYLSFRIMNYTWFIRLILLGRCNWFKVFTNSRARFAFFGANQKVAVHLRPPAKLGHKNLLQDASMSASLSALGMAIFSFIQTQPLLHYWHGDHTSRNWVRGWVTYVYPHRL